MYKKSHNSKVQSNSSRCRTCLIILALLTVGLISLFFTSLIDVQKLEDKIIGSTIKTETSTTPTTKKEKELIRKEPIQSIISDSSSVSRTVDNVDRSNGVISSKVEKQFPLIKQAQNGEIHFIHIPKCGGTTMTTILRQIQCAVDPVQNADCCLNPGFCDWHAHRRCSTIKGCINHFPQRYCVALFPTFTNLV